MSDLPADLHPDRMTACFRTARSSSRLAMLGSEPRFAERLASLIRRHYDLGDAAPGDGGTQPDHLLAALPLKELERLAERAGIVLRARNFLGEIRGPVLAALTERFGADAFEDARLHVDLAGGRSGAVDLDGLQAAVRTDGIACLAAWVASLPGPMSRRVRLKWPNDAAVPSTMDSEIIERGPTILRRLIASASQSR